MLCMIKVRGELAQIVDVNGDFKRLFSNFHMKY